MGVEWGPETPDEASEGLASGPVPVPAFPSCVGGSGLFTYLLRASACWPVSNDQLVSSAVEDAVKERIPPLPQELRFSVLWPPGGLGPHLHTGKQERKPPAFPFSPSRPLSGEQRDYRWVNPAARENRCFSLKKVGTGSGAKAIT